jgi:hypothetical protein
MIATNPHLLKQWHEFGVFEVVKNGTFDYQISRLPKTKKFIRDFQPTSVLENFPSADAAIQALEHWVEERKNLKKSKKVLDPSQQMTFNL